MLGDTVRALAAVRRRGYNGNEMASCYREEGRYAAATGDRAGGIRAYRAYLTRRSRPDRSVQSQSDSVRAELTRLESGR